MPRRLVRVCAGSGSNWIWYCPVGGFGMVWCGVLHHNIAIIIVCIADKNIIGIEYDIAFHVFYSGVLLLSKNNIIV